MYSIPLTHFKEVNKICVEVNWTKITQGWGGEKTYRRVYQQSSFHHEPHPVAKNV